MVEPRNPEFHPLGQRVTLRPPPTGQVNPGRHQPLESPGAFFVVRLLLSLGALLMNKSLIVAAVLGLSLSSGAALASADLAKAKNCLACHAADKKVVGPSYKDVAAKYASDKDAVAKLAKKIREGGVGNWGQIPMPANPQVSDAEAQTLAKWVMSQK